MPIPEAMGKSMRRVGGNVKLRKAIASLGWLAALVLAAGAHWKP
jgi:hypothetical protein